MSDEAAFAPPSPASAPARRPERLTGVKGMNDLLPGDSERWERLEQVVAHWARSYGYRQVRTPIVEHTALFRRGIGEVTDIVEKEMYSFEDALNGEHLTLRPENTAGVVRAAIEHNLLYDGPKRLWYTGPMFRHERPQRGRYRQFHQIGVEALGFAGPDIDAEVIAMCRRLWDDLGLEDIRLELNSIGDPAERRGHREALVAYLEAHRDRLDADAQRRLHTNPLRILDTKNPAMQDLVEGAPRLADFLGAASREHFEGVQSLLRAVGIPFRVNPRLVRGLDYYNAIGVERLLELMKERGGAEPGPGCDVYVVHQGEAARTVAFTVSEALRGVGLDVVMHAGGGAFKAQFKRADASGAEFAVVIGDDEAAARTATVKALRGADGERGAGRQESVSLDALPDYLVDALVATGD